MGHAALSDAGYHGYDTNLKIGASSPEWPANGLWLACLAETDPAAPKILIGAAERLPSSQPYGGHRGLIMNKNGYRFGNEDVNGSYEGIAIMHQPEMKAFAIWDSNYAEASAPWRPFGSKFTDDPVAPADMMAKWDAAVENGSIIQSRYH
jgi:hypothetical protein